MNNPIEKAFTSAVTAMAKKRATHYSTENRTVKGIAERPRPASTGWCGNDNCEHQNHKQMRSAQAAADKRAGVKVQT